MQRVLLKVFAVALPLFIGCATVSEWAAGSITEGIPKLRDKLPRNAKVHFADPVNERGYALHERNRKQVQDAFGKAFDSLGVVHSVETNGCDYSLYIVVDNWAYGDSGFMGPGGRDEVSMSVLLQKSDTKRVVTRASLYARNLELLVAKYVKGLFEDGKK